MITRVLSHLRLITLSKHACVCLEGEGMINIRPTSPEILSPPPLYQCRYQPSAALWTHAYIWPWVDNQPHTPSSVGLIYLYLSRIRICNAVRENKCRLPHSRRHCTRPLNAFITQNLVAFFTWKCRKGSELYVQFCILMQILTHLMSKMQILSLILLQ